MQIRAVGFDIDGTLYPERKMYAASFPLLVRDPGLIYHFSKARKILRNAAQAGEEFVSGFRTRQAEAVLQSMGRQSPADSQIREMKERISHDIYGRWENLYRSIRPFRGVRQAWLELRNLGLKTGLLSDFPLGCKPSALGIADLSDAFCCSEETGYLKPRIEPFSYLADTLGVHPSQILYVGNSYEKDVIGARSAGMKTAMILPAAFHSARRYPLADFVFTDFRDLPTLLTSYLM